ncbi:transposase [Bacillus pumilus]|uniref:transposase n=1 Tax=Bacillus pumilus TaxID=1408 RepID=UPI000E44586B|nr:hypothetical protein FZC68_20395 [Bacillus pumilus]
MNHLSDSGKELYQKRKEKIERSFADLKTTARASLLPSGGKQNVSEQVLLTVACQNMKKIATLLAKLD